MTGDLFVQLALGGFGLTGVIGALVALLKIRPEASSAAVTDAQGAMKTMRELNDELEATLERVRSERDAAVIERNDARDRARGAEAQVRVLERQVRQQLPPA